MDQHPNSWALVEQDAILPCKLSSMLFVVEWQPSTKLPDISDTVEGRQGCISAYGKARSL